MAKKYPLEKSVRNKLSRFLAKPGRIAAAMSVLKGWEERGWGPILFGGVVRDLIVLGGRYYPRDVDVVLQNTTTDELMTEFSSYEYKVNRFGGLHLNVNRWTFDVWPLEKTWAFANNISIPPIPEYLPMTTFLDVEAIAVTLNGPDRVGSIYSNGFFQAVERRCIGINYADNPFPELCAVRAIITACKLRFGVSPDLAKYFVRAVREHNASDLVSIQERHYGKVILRASDIRLFEEHFLRALSEGNHTVIPLPHRFNPTQLCLWPET